MRREQIAAIDGLLAAFRGKFFNEFVVSGPLPAGDDCWRDCVEQEIVGGLELARFFPEMTNEILVCVTEVRIARRDRSVWSRHWRRSAQIGRSGLTHIRRFDDHTRPRRSGTSPAIVTGGIWRGIGS
jgi:hypothetical protein